MQWITDQGGSGRPIILLHGLMGRGSTWSEQLPWLKRYGQVYTYDAPWHRGRDVMDLRPITTELFVADIAQHLDALAGEAAVLIGHSMGGLHAWCLAAERPDLVAALVIEDMSPDFSGRTAGSWAPWFDAWPQTFGSAEQIYSMFGPTAGRYFLEAFDRTEFGWQLHGDIPTWRRIAEHWGTRNYWDQWRKVLVPKLILEAEFSITPPGQMREMAKSPKSSYLQVGGGGHLIHGDAPDIFRGAVEAFLSGLS
ncbi:MAG: alpha/beta fold hydrolase [Mycobacteriaceae bacterium]